MRAEATNKIISSKGNLDYVLKLIDVCEFENMEPLQSIPEKLVFKVG